jgi:DNA processing protein
MFEDSNIGRAMYHYGLCHEKKVYPASDSGDVKLSGLIDSHGSLESVFTNELGMIRFAALSQDEELIKVHKKIQKKLGPTSIIVRGDDNYPQRLVDHNRAPVLYTRGDSSLLSSGKSIAVIGTREPSNQMYDRGAEAVRRLVTEGYVVISGLALGCDEFGHRIALQEGGRAIGVIGNSIDRRYPKEHVELHEVLERDQLLVSQFPLEYFLGRGGKGLIHRNKTMVSLTTDGVLVLESGDKSGTQHAVRECVKQGKPVYVLEHNMDRGYKWTTKYRDSIKVVRPR